MSNAAPATDDGTEKLIGETLASRYQIESLLGEGAMGVVYKARHVKVGRPFAVKVLHKKLLEDRKVAQRFDREAELAGRLRHPNVIGVVDVGETSEGTRYMVMDFAEGEDLAALLAEAPMTPERIIHLIRQILEGLYHAHEAGLIHRDLKPENVIVERDDHGTEVPRIVDFGIAILREGGDSASADGRLTTNGLVLGTPHYMAPEQAVADPIDHRIDLFALGIVVYEMLCGKLPFDGSGAEVARANLLLDPPAIATRVPYLEVDPLLEAYARLLMQKKREDRPATAKAARELLDLIARDRAAAAQQLGVPAEIAKVSMRTAQSTPLEGSVPEDLAIPFERSGPAKSAPVQIPAPITQPSAAVQSLPTGPRSQQHTISTDAAQPLRYGADRETLGPTQKPRRGAMIAIAAVAALALVLVIALALGGKKHPATATETVVMAPTVSPPVVDPTPTPTPTPPVVDPTPTPTPTPPVVDDTATNTNTNVATPNAGSDQGSATEAVAIPTKNPGTKKPKDGTGKTVKPTGDTHEIAKPVGTTPPDNTTKPTPTASEQLAGPLTAKSVSDHYRRVGAAIGKLQKSAGDDAVSDLWTRYRRIQIQKAVSSPAEMTSADKELSQIESLVSKASK